MVGIGFKVLVRPWTRSEIGGRTMAVRSGFVFASRLIAAYRHHLPPIYERKRVEIDMQERWKVASVLPHH